MKGAFFTPEDGTGVERLIYDCLGSSTGRRRRRCPALLFTNLRSLLKTRIWEIVLFWLWRSVICSDRSRGFRSLLERVLPVVHYSNYTKVKRVLRALLNEANFTVRIFQLLLIAKTFFSSFAFFFPPFFYCARICYIFSTPGSYLNSFCASYLYVQYK